VPRYVSPLRGNDFYSPSDEAVSARVSGDTHARVRIDAGGRITWGTGSGTGDTKLYRTESNSLLTDGIFSASGGVVTLTTSGSPTVSMADGAIAIDSTNNVFYYRSSGEWRQVVAGGGSATIEISDTPPVAPDPGDLWFDSTDATTYIYYDSFWIDINGQSSVTPNLEELANVDVSFQGEGDVLVYIDSLDEWVNVPIYAANPRTLTTLTSSAATVIGTFPLEFFKSGEFTVEMEQGSKTTATKVMVAHNDSISDFAQFGTVQIGSPAIAATFSTNISGSAVQLLVSVSDAATTNVNVMASKQLMRHLHT